MAEENQKDKQLEKEKQLEDEPRRQEVGAPTVAPDPAPTEASELEKCKKERDEYLAGWQRAKADFSNYQKDEARRNEEFAKWALAAFIRELLDILDSFDLAINQTKSETERMGLALIRSQFMAVLAKYGLQQIRVEQGMKFNPELHEAVSHLPADAGLPADQAEDTILEELQKGYTLHDRVLRPAKVTVATQKS